MAFGPALGRLAGRPARSVIDIAHVSAHRGGVGVGAFVCSYRQVGILGDDEGEASTVGGVLSYQACSCHALLALLARWSSFSERMGGFRNDGERAACSDLLSALLKALYVGGDLRVTLALGKDWANMWPRPDCSRHTATVAIDGDGILDLQALQDEAGMFGEGRVVAKQWRDSIIASSAGDLSIQNVLCKAGVFKPLASFFRQLVWHLGQQLQMSIQRRLAGDSVIHGISAKTVHIGQVLGDAPLLDRQLARYIASARSSVGGCRQLSVATDKSVVGSLAMQATAIAFPPNMCAVAPPQVVEQAHSTLAEVSRFGGLAAVKAAKIDQSFRHRLWLKRKHQCISSGSWQPRKKFRTAAMHWLYGLDNQEPGGGHGPNQDRLFRAHFVFLSLLRQSTSGLQSDKASFRNQAGIVGLSNCALRPTLGDFLRFGRRESVHPPLFSASELLARRRMARIAGDRCGGHRPAPQVRSCTTVGGLSGFIMRSGDEQWSAENWADWPHLSIAMDQGPDGISASWWLHHMKANVTIFCDPSHGSWADLKQVLKDNKMFAWWLLLMVAWNVPHGPWNDDQRHALLRETWGDMVSMHGPKSLALFQQYAAEMLADMGGEASLGQSCETSTVEDAVWQFMVDDPPIGRKGMKINLNRFFHGLEFAREDLHRWHSRLLAYEYTALEQGMLQARRAEKVRMRPPGRDGDEEPKPTTDSSQLNMAERGIRAGGQNALEIAVGVLGDRLNNIMVRLLLAAAAPTEAWFRQQAHELRSCEASTKWLARQVGGEFMQHINSTLQTLCSRSSVEYCRFLIDPKAFSGEKHEVQGEALLQDELASMLGRLVTGLMALRFKRCLWMICGWPVRILGVLGPDNVKRETLKAFAHDHAAAVALDAVEDPSTAVKAFQARSVFKRVAVQNLVEATRALDEAKEAELQRFVAERYGGLISSQICEDMLNSAKNAKTMRSGKKYRRPERAMCSILARDVPAKVHSYDAVATDHPLPRRCIKLGPEIFAASRSQSSVNCASVSSTASKPAWYSPGASNFTQADADLAVVSEAYRLQNWEFLSRAWEGLFCCAGHDLLVKLPGETTWMLALYHWPDSAVLLWPAALHEVPAYPNKQYIKFEAPLEKPWLGVVTDIEAVCALPFVWRSPMWQLQEFKKAPREFCLAVRAYPSGTGRDSLVKVAAMNAFWLVDKVCLDRLARSRGVSLPPGKSLFGTVSALVEQFVGGSPDQVLAIASKRLARLRNAETLSEGILDLDEAVECLDSHDQKVVATEKQSAKDLKSEVEEYRKEYRQKVSEVRASSSSAASGSGRRAKNDSKAKAPAIPARLPPPSTIAHADAKRYAPPGAYIWRSVVAGAWQGHLKPYCRVGRSWARYGEHEALRLVIADLWDKWLDSQGKQRSECPIAGIFEGPDGAFQVEGASSSAGV